MKRIKTIMHSESTGEYPNSLGIVRTAHIRNPAANFSTQKPDILFIKWRLNRISLNLRRLSQKGFRLPIARRIASLSNPLNKPNQWNIRRSAHNSIYSGFLSLFAHCIQSREFIIRIEKERASFAKLTDKTGYDSCIKRHYPYES